MNQITASLVNDLPSLFAVTDGEWLVGTADQWFETRHYVAAKHPRCQQAVEMMRFAERSARHFGGTFKLPNYAEWAAILPR